MDEAEVSNINYRGYLWWLKFLGHYILIKVYIICSSDTLVWHAEELAYNEPLVKPI